MHPETQGNPASAFDPAARGRGSAAEVALYVALAIALCWAVAAPGLLGLMDADVAPALVPLAQFTPLLATVPFFVWRRPGRVVDVLALRWNRSGRWTALGLGVLTLISAVQLGLGVAVGWHPRPNEAVLAALAALVPVFAAQAVFAFGEEAGWRGWLVSRTRPWGFVRAAGLSAAVWAAWHVPAVLLFPDFSDEQAAAYLLGIASWAPFLVALRWVSGSVWPAVLAHAGINSIRVFLLQSVAQAGGVDWRVEASGWVLWLGAALLLMRRTRGAA